MVLYHEIHVSFLFLKFMTKSRDNLIAHGGTTALKYHNLFLNNIIKIMLHWYGENDRLQNYGKNALLLKT